MKNFYVTFKMWGSNITITIIKAKNKRDAEKMAYERYSAYQIFDVKTEYMFNKDIISKMKYEIKEILKVEYDNPKTNNDKGEIR